MIIAVDFDNTLAITDFPKILAPKVKVIKFIKKRRSMGDTIILWSCRNGKYLDEAVEWCKLQGLVFDAINDDAPEVIREWGNNRSKKITADLYIDDMCINVKDLV